MWQLALQLTGDRRPLFVQIASAIEEAIQRGRLRAGEPLPSTRKLAEQLAIHRKTVTAAYRELANQGWIDVVPARGARVAAAFAAPQRPVMAIAKQAGFELPPLAIPKITTTPPRPKLLRLLGGVPELRFVPHALLARAYRNALRGPRAAQLLSYGEPQGEPSLREAIAELLSLTRGVHATAETVAIVRGSQQALYLAARALLRPGDRVAVEALGYPSGWGALRLAGAVLEPIATDRDGLDVAALEAACANQTIKAVYVTPHHQYPTTVTLTAARRVRLLELARRHRMLILEDDYDHEFQYDGRPVLPLASADRHGVVVYLGTLSKTLAPGLRLGYVAATADVIQRIAAYRALVDHHGDHVLERAIADLMTDGDIARHVRRVRRAYRSRRDALCAALHRELPSLVVTAPHGGMALWAHAPGVDVDAWVARARALDVAFQAASRFTFDGRPRPFARIGFAACTERELADAARRMAACLPRRRR